MSSAAGSDSDPSPNHNAIKVDADDAYTQPDVLLGFLEEFSESIKQEESCSPIDDEASLATVTSSAPTSPHMVGPTATELESINELIRFDHVYVKSEQTKPVTLQVSSPAAAAARPMVSLLRPIQPKTATPSIINSATVKQEKEEDIVVKSGSDAPLNLHLGDMDLEALSDSIHGLVDFDTMFKDLVQTQDELTTDAAVDLPTTPHITASSNPVNPLKRKSPDTPEFEVKKVKSDDLKINLSVEGLVHQELTTPDPAETGYMFDFDSSVGNSSGYISDEACSPKSDDSGLLENNLNWEDQSFSELFPSLV